MQQQIQAGGGVVLRVNGSIVGFATSCSYTRTQNTKVQMGIDSPFAAEIHPTTYLVTGTLTGIRLRGSGGLDGKGIMDISTPEKVFSQQYVLIEIVDRLSNENICTFKNVMFDSDSWSFAAKSLVSFNANFKAFFVTNETS